MGIKLFIKSEVNMSENKNEVFYLPIILLIYGVTNIFMFLNNGLYWDDWCLSTEAGIIDLYIGVGYSFLTPIMNYLITLTQSPALFFHILTGITEIITIFLFYKILLLFKLNKSNIFLLTLFYAILPYNQTKITIICFGYSLGFLFFTVAVYLYFHCIDKKSMILRLFSLIFFFLSYIMLPSTLILGLAVFLLNAILIEKNIILNINYIKIIFKKLLTWFDFVILPFIFLIFKFIVLKPQGIYVSEGYRSVTLKSFLLAPLNILLSFIQNITGLIFGIDSSNPINNSKIFALLFLVMFIVVFIILKSYKTENKSNNKYYLFIGIYLFLAGVFAYNIIGLPPLFNAFEARHQILLKIGTPFVLLYLINLIVSEKAKIFILAGIISLFITSTISTQLQFQKSWFKQTAIEHNIANNNLLKNEMNLLVIDNTQEYNEFKTGYAFYVYNGLFAKTFKTQNKFIIDSKQIKRITSKYTLNEFIKYASYNMKECKNPEIFNYYLVIDSTSEILTDVLNLKLLYLYYFNKKMFDELVEKIISVKLLNID